MTRPFVIVPVLWLAIASGVSANAQTQTPPVPVSNDPGIQIELVAAEPDIVTPIGCRFDSQGRLLVIESHTHFPPENYEGPKTDRIKLLDDPDGDGSLNRIRVFYEGTSKTMGIALGTDDSVYLITRSELLRLRDTNNDDVADQVQTLVTFETETDYPHNGLGGLLVEQTGPETGTITFGIGENFGSTYRLIGSDGSQQVGSGEGGNVFTCDLNGGQITRFATGVWNPFGICRDTAGRLLLVDNDADAMPPCRILDVQQAGDYGFEFRFGRTGTHPLQAWDGELPGTLPMLAGTGEAPCAIIDFRGQYWVTSWGDNRIERYQPYHQGGLVKAERQGAILGDANFRPVDLAVDRQGALYVTDWVDRSYNVHRKGRIWKLTFAQPVAPEITLPISVQEQQAKQPREPQTELDKLASERWNWLCSQQSQQDQQRTFAAIERSLRSADAAVRLLAIRWAAETADKRFLPLIEAQWNQPNLSSRTVAAIAAAISYLELGRVEGGGFDQLTYQRLVAFVGDSTKPNDVRAQALRLVPPEASQWSIELLKQLISNQSGPLQQEAARHLAVLANSNSAAKTTVQSLIDTGNLPEAVKLDLQLAFHTNANSGEVTTIPAELATGDVDAWMKLVGSGGDPQRGWRVFFNAGGAKCSSCHMHQGRGQRVGPDLSTLGGTTDRRRVLESILHPSREIGPMYTPWKVLTTDGQTVVGIKLNGGGVGQSLRYLRSDSSTIDVPLEQVESQELSDVSIMPAGLAQLLTVDEMRDLLAYLTQSQP